MRIVIPGGERAIVAWSPPVTTVSVRAANGTTRVITGFMQGMPGSCPAGIAGQGGSGLWLNPMDPGSYTITQPFASWHSGLDLAGVTGGPVRAADTGVVIFAGWNNYGYGDLVVLDHGNGWTTYYAHLNSNSVGCGATVQRGQVVGGVGSTGNVTGPHLHFEMRWLHTPDNPAGYIAF
jgi:murein DD-endopeptidase MepM/ murein hydrolase activator NlpD